MLLYKVQCVKKLRNHKFEENLKGKLFQATWDILELLTR